MANSSNLGPPDAIWQPEYPFESHYMQLSDQVRQHYIDEGPRDSKHTILAVHGNPTWSFYYRSIATKFRDQCRVIAVDHVGCGGSDKPESYDYCLAQHTANLVQLIDNLQLTNVTMVVHDWGGAIGLGAAVARQSSIRNILVLNTGAFPPPYIPMRIAACRWPWIGSFAIRYFNAFAWTATFMAIDRLPRLSQVAKAGLLAPYDSPSHRVAIDRFVQDIPMSPTHKTYRVLEELEQRLGELSNKRIHFVWGMKDWCFRPECMERMAKAWPHATRRELADVGHYVMEEAPNEVADELQQILQSDR